MQCYFCENSLQKFSLKVQQPAMGLTDQQLNTFIWIAVFGCRKKKYGRNRMKSSISRTKILLENKKRINCRPLAKRCRTISCLVLLLLCMTWHDHSPAVSSQIQTYRTLHISLSVFKNKRKQKKNI